MIVRTATMFALALTAACATGPRPMAVRAAAGAELVGRQVRVETAQGQVSTLYFEDKGRVRARFGEHEVSGSWYATADRLCFSWAGTTRECWPYQAPLRQGQTLALSSDRGNQVRVTLQ